MTDQEKITALRNIVGGSDTDEVLSTYLNLAGKKIIAKAYPYKADDGAVPSQYEYLQIEIAAYMMNKRGAEGQVTHTENGLQRQYENADVPYSMLKTITPFCGSVGG
ncbi:MAG: phage head-tail connector protein [Clostridia bacterium]|nr:phage head-tail connector protein [Clostridia bacterium]